MTRSCSAPVWPRKTRAPAGRHRAVPGGDGQSGGSAANGPSVLLITDTLTIVGPAGAGGITIARSASSLVLRLFETTAAGDLTLQNLILTGGTAHFVGAGNAGLGGGVFNAGTVAFTNCSLTANSTDQAGGGVYTAGALTIADSTFSANSVTNGGGGIYAGQGTVTISDSTFSGNAGGNGGALYGGSVATLNNCTFFNNGASSGGGAIWYAGGPLSVSGCTFSRNTAQNGGALYDQASTTIAGSTFSANQAETYGGGAIDNRGALAVSNCTFVGNTAKGSIQALGGGAIDNLGVLTVSNSTFSANSCGGRGGAIDSNGTLTVRDSTLTANRAFSPNPGGVTGSGGGGIYNFATATLSGDIVAGNFNDISPGGVRDDLAGERNVDTLHSTHNLIGLGGGAGLADGQNGNQVGVAIADVGLAPLRNYSGPTQTIALLPGSLAVARGVTETAATTDQRGVARPVGSPSDVGAFQSRGFALSVVGGDGQTAVLGQPFADALVVQLAANDPNVPVDGTVVTFTAPPSTGPSAVLSAATAVVAGGRASVQATANGHLGGPYEVAVAAPDSTPAAFRLTNTDVVQFAAAGEAVNENAGMFSVTVSLSAPSDAATTVPFTVGGTAVAGVDYSSVTAGPLVIPAGQTAGTITGTLIDDGAPDVTKTLTIALGTPVNATLGTVTTNTLTLVEPPTGDVVVNATGGDDTLLLERTPGGGLGSITYILNTNPPVSLTAVTSFTFNGLAGNDTMIVSFANGGPLVPRFVYFDGGPGSDTFVVDAHGKPVITLPGSVTVEDPQIAYGFNAETFHIKNAAAVDAFGGPDTADRDAAFAGLTAQERFVQALYLDELGRPGATAELDGWAAVFNAPGLTQAQAQAAIAAGIDNSAEARDHLVRGWYAAYLGRQAQGGEEHGWVGLLLAGQPEERVLSRILASPEFYARAQTLIASGTADERFVQALYQLLLDRPGVEPAAEGWVGAVATAGRQGVALGFLAGPSGTEFRTDQFEGYYNALLHRPDDAAGLSGWVFSNLDMEAVRVGFESGTEFMTDG